MASLAGRRRRRRSRGNRNDVLGHGMRSSASGCRGASSARNSSAARHLQSNPTTWKVGMAELQGEGWRAKATSRVRNAGALPRKLGEAGRRRVQREGVKLTSSRAGCPHPVQV